MYKHAYYPDIRIYSISLFSWKADGEGWMESGGKSSDWKVMGSPFHSHAIHDHACFISSSSLVMK